MHCWFSWTTHDCETRIDYCDPAWCMILLKWVLFSTSFPLKCGQRQDSCNTLNIRLFLTTGCIFKLHSMYCVTLPFMFIHSEECFIVLSFMFTVDFSGPLMTHLFIHLYFLYRRLKCLSFPPLSLQLRAISTPNRNESVSLARNVTFLEKSAGDLREAIQ